MDTLQDVVGSTDPRARGLDVRARVPPASGPSPTTWVSPRSPPSGASSRGSDLAAAVSAWQNSFGGGPLGWIEVSQQATALPTYLMADIGRDWGALERYEPYGGVDTLADIETGTQTRSGLWSPAPIRY